MVEKPEKLDEPTNLGWATTTLGAAMASKLGLCYHSPELSALTVCFSKIACRFLVNILNPCRWAYFSTCMRSKLFLILYLVGDYFMVDIQFYFLLQIRTLELGREYGFLLLFMFLSLSLKICANFFFCLVKRYQTSFLFNSHFLHENGDILVILFIV